MSYETDVDVTKFAEVLPKPTGYRILIAIAKASNKAGSIWKPDDLVEKETVATVAGLVIATGPDAYADDKKFPSGPYCQIGDWVSFRQFSGTRFRVGDQEFRMINDDQVESVLPDPTAIERV